MEIRKLVSECEKELESIFKSVDELTFRNSEKILKAWNKWSTL